MNQKRAGTVGNVLALLVVLALSVGGAMASVQPAAAAASIAYIGDIGSATIKDNTVASLTLTTTAAVAAGDAIIVVYATDAAQNLVVAATDTALNTYVSAGPATSTGNLRTYVFAAYGVTPLPSGSSITFTQSGYSGTAPAARVAVASVFRGLASTSALDQTKTASGTSAAPSSGASAATTQADELLIGAVGTEGPDGDTAGTWGGSFTAGQRLGTTGGATDDTNITASMGWRIVSATGAYTAQKSGTTSRDWAALIATFKADIAVVTHSLTMAVSPGAGGSTNPAVGAHTYPEGAVAISATPSSGYVFDHWEGSVADASSASTTVTLDADKTVTAYFAAAASIAYVGEVGSVTANDAGTTLQIPVGAAGVAAGNTIIVGFASRGASGYTDPTVTDSGGNTYGLATFAVTYQHGRSYIYYAHVDTALEAGDSITITSFSVASRVAVASVFSGLAASNVLDRVLQNPTGTTTTAQGNSPTVGPTGTTTQADELIVGVIGTEEATDAGVGTWLNGFAAGPQVKTTGATNEWRVSMGYQVVSATGGYTAAKTVANNPYWAASIATFRAGPAPATHDLTVTVDPAGGGTTAPAAGSHAYPEGSVVDITAAANPGYAFDDWGGDCAGSGPCQVTMTGDMAVTANFSSLAPTGAATSAATPSDAAPSVGEQIDVEINVDVSGVNPPDDELGSFSATLDWDPTVLGYDSDSGLLAGFTGAVNAADAATGHLVFNGANSGGAGGDVTVFRVTFDVIGSGTSSLDLGYSAMAAASTFKSLLSLLTVTDGQVNVDVVTHVLTVAVDPAGGGTTSPSAGGHSYAEGAVVDVTATAAAGYQFANWTGACTGSGACQVTMSTDRSVTAHFAQVTHVLTVAVDPAGSGTTSPSAGGHSYAEGAVVDVTATAAAGYQFANWTGACTGSGTCQVTMSADKSVTAHFAQITHVLTVAVDPAGSGTTSPSAGGHSYAEGAVVDVTATAAAGYQFANWTGACTGSGACQVTMSADKSVTAHFAQVTHVLTVAVDPAGSGTTSPSAGGHSYAEGALVDVTATAAAGYQFANWTGACTGSGACQVTMSTDKSVTAHFEEAVPGSITYVGDVGRATVKDNTVDDLVVTTTGAVAAGDDIVVVYVTDPAQNLVVAVSDSAGNTYEEAGYAVNQAQVRTYIFAAYNVIALPSGGVITVSYVSSDTDAPAARAALVGVFRGLADVDPLDQTKMDYGSSASPSSGAAGMTAQADELLVGAVGTEGPDGDTAGTWGNSFTGGPRLGTTGGTADTNVTASMGWRIVAATGAYTAQKSGVTSRDWATMIATFKAGPSGPSHNLTVAVDPAAGGTTDPAAGTHSYPEGTVVDVSATAAAGYEFVNWTGACTGTGTCQVTMSADKSVTAHFAQITHVLTVAVDPAGSGTTSPSAGGHSYAEGAVVDVTATAAAGYQFANWTGACTGSGACQVTMSADKSVTAHFEEAVPGTITYVGDIGTATVKASGTSLVVTTTQAVELGDTIIVGYATDPAQDLVVGVTDSEGNTYQQAALAVNWGNGRTYIFYAHADSALPAGSAITITGDQAVTARAAVVSVFSGVAEVNVVDQAMGNPALEDETTASGSTPAVGPTGMTAQADELLIGVIGTEGPVEDAAGTWDYGFTARSRVGTTGGTANTNWTVSLGYRIVGTTGEYTAQKSGVTGRNYAATIATFRAGDAVTTYSLTMAVSPAGGGTTDPAAGIHTYSEGAVVGISATAATGRHFVSWSGSVANPDSASTTVTMDADRAVTANFALDTFTLDYAAGAGGSLSGDTSQGVAYGGDGTPVAALPATGYHFAQWSDGSTANPRTDADVTADVSVTASFALDTFTLDYAAGAGGSLSGDTSQVVAYGGDGTPVSALPATGYHFVQWSDGSTANPRTDADVTADVSVTASFALDTFTLDYAAGAGGSLSGDTSQVVAYGASGSPVTAVADGGYQFAGWSDGATDNPRTDASVTADVSVTATFEPVGQVQHTLTVAVDPGGGGTTSPAVGAHGYAQGAVVSITATPADGYEFTNWSGDVADPSSASTTVTMGADKSVTAHFVLAAPAPMVRHFLPLVDR